MTLKREPGNGRAQRCAVEGDVTIYTVMELKEELLSVLAQCEALELDLAGVADIDSAGLQLLVMLKTAAVAKGKTLSLSGHSAPVLDILELCNLESFFGDPVLIRSPG